MFCENCGAVLPDGAQFCTSCGTKVAGTRVVAAPPSPPSPDYNVELAELHQRVVQEELGLLATIDESGYVNFENELGKLYIVLQKSIPEYMGLHCMFYRGETHALQNLRRICNSVNESSLLALLTVDDSCFVVSAKVQLFLAGHGRMPDEILLRGVIGSAMSSIKSAVEKFAELQKVDSAPAVKVAPTTDSKPQLAELYQRVVQDELGLTATIEEDGDVLFDHPELGGFFISINAERDPENMKLVLPAFVVEATRWATAEDLMRICNGVNVKFKLATLSLHENANNGVTASVRLLLAPPDTMPDEILLRGVISRAMSSIKSAVEEFADELRKLVPSLP